ncbi:MAG TPA: competence protein ComFB [bacterium]|nr:competence protein ComFB [bacterium]
MGILDQYNFDILVNEAERLVVEEMERQLPDRADVCTCEECVMDIAAYALNKIKPYYRVSLMGTLYAHAIDDSTYAKEIKKTVNEAIKKISSNPSHE